MSHKFRRFVFETHSFVAYFFIEYDLRTELDFTHVWRGNRLHDEFARLE